MSENTQPAQNSGAPQELGNSNQAIPQDGGGMTGGDLNAKPEAAAYDSKSKAPLSFKPVDDIGLRLVTKDGKQELAPIEGAAGSADAGTQPAKKPRKKRTRKKREVETHEVYFEDTFFDALIADLEKATTLVIIHCPFIKDYRLKKLIATLKACIERGVRVCVFIKYPEEGFDTAKEIKQRIELCIALLEIRCHVTLRLHIHEKLIIIDEFIFWEGSCNTLSQAGSYERLPRWHGRSKVLEVIESHGLRDCRECHVIRLKTAALSDPAASKRKILGAIIRRRRMEMSLTQQELAACVQIGRQAIREVESGLGDPKLSTIERICDRLHLEIRVVLWVFVASLDEKLTMESATPQIRVQKARRSPWDKESNELYSPGQIQNNRKPRLIEQEQFWSETIDEPDYFSDPNFPGNHP